MRRIRLVDRAARPDRVDDDAIALRREEDPPRPDPEPVAGLSPQRGDVVGQRVRLRREGVELLPDEGLDVARQAAERAGGGAREDHGPTHRRRVNHT
ncbi:hypothetical protein QA634_33845 [Methylobacterium sp. CB376]|uniref:hypothetical protein n=1 Tax=unclassified Methylobacterium TaxID=2615210 RepID=UPI0002FD836B|nr:MULTISPECIES: hypothetical protein [Methylobacterium]WFT80107.1 hypothetical protein QA634_33845 [Methylobacterium nodulans]